MEDQLLTEALEAFKKQYPTINSGDLQTFILGWQAAIKATNSTKIGFQLP